MDLYFVTVILNPTQKQKHDDGAVPQIVVTPFAVLAKDASAAGVRALKAVPTEYENFTDRLEVRSIRFQ